MEKTRTIVVVDDDQIQAKLLNDYLTENGYQVRVAFTGQDGIQAIHETHPDLVILDLYLPDTKGTDVCTQLRANMATRNIPVILCTAHNIGTAEKLAGFRAGVDDFLLRPFELAELQARIEAILRRADATPRKELLEGLEVLLNKNVELTPPADVAKSQLEAALTFSAPPSPISSAVQPRPFNFVHRVWELLNHPKRAFSTFDENSDFLVAVFLVFLTPLLMSFSGLTKKSTGFDDWIGIVSLGIILHAILWVGTAGLLNLVLPIQGVAVSMRTALGIAGLTWAPRLLAGLFSCLFSLLSFTGWIGESAKFSSGIDIIPGMPAASWVATFSHVGLFDLWCTALTLIGVWTFAGGTEQRWTTSTYVIATVTLLCGAFINS